MATFTCPKCGAIAQAQLVWQGGEITRSMLRANYSTYDAAFRCVNCGRVVGATADKPDPATADLLDFWPRKLAGKDFPDVPTDIASAANEAHQCFSIGALRGAIGLARAVIEATAKNHGITSGNLEKKIDQMATNGLIGQDTAEAAHAVRLWGNDAAHGDLALEAFSSEDAEEVLALMDEVLSRAYQGPARVKRIIDSRNARKAGQPGGVPDVQP
ncbi:uncharacterized protein DUF4145 [Kribbella sp. VKM Ac-2571]|uniref:DUF4145 domain-containing protein n=1 Tax=Kribbella sp. VKM Ac-2571 TaxID=2512222 RepID=UPI0010F0F036|nr:DUF4145 domain-containing protein [Kribbella sp. VKM Ac-2571]TDO68484.1 uncharacterized protein DUF4145 [Kribbella sp. VKM Ac-2571]